MAVERAEVVVVGGGLGGLAAAALLARSGLKPLVLEKSSHPGGRGVTHLLAGQRFNLGPHALYLGGPAKRVLDSLGVSFSGGSVEGQGGFALRAGRLHTLPSGPLSMLTTGLLGVSGKLELGRFLARLGRLDTRALAGVPLREWVETTFATADARGVISMMLRVSTYCGDAERLSAGFALEQLRVAMRGVLYLDGGWQTLVDGLVAELARAGVPLRTNVRVERVVPTLDGWRVESGDGAIEARAVVLACPPATVRSLLQGTAAVGLEPLGALVPVQAACLDLAVDRLPEPKRLIALGVDAPLYASVHSRFAKLTTGGHAVVHLAKYLASEADGEGAEAELEALADALQPGWRERVVARRFLPKMTVSHALPTVVLRGLEGRPPVAMPGAPGLFAVGDWAGSRGHLLDAVMASAEEAAAGVAALAARPKPAVVPLRPGTTSHTVARA